MCAHVCMRYTSCCAGQRVLQLSTTQKVDYAMTQHGSLAESVYVKEHHGWAQGHNTKVSTTVQAGATLHCAVSAHHQSTACQDTAELFDPGTA